MKMNKLFDPRIWPRSQQQPPMQQQHQRRAKTSNASRKSGKSIKRAIWGSIRNGFRRLVCCDGIETSREPSVQTQNNDPRPDVRLFLVGTGGAGKSTIIKQIQKLCLLHPDRYQMYDETWHPQPNPLDESKRSAFVQQVHDNVFKCVGVLIERFNEKELQFATSEQTEAAERLMDIIEDSSRVHMRNLKLTPEMTEWIKLIWPSRPETVHRDPEYQGTYPDIQGSCPYDPGPEPQPQCSSTADSAVASGGGNCVSLRNVQYDGQVPDSAEYFLDHRRLNEMCKPDYKPSPDDILRLRRPTDSLTDYNFRIHSMYFTIRDTGGQKTERPRLRDYIPSWINHNDARTAKNFILFVASMSDYNVELPPEMSTEGKKRTKLDWSVGLWRQIHQNFPDTHKCGLMLFLNKYDYFMELQSHLKDMKDWYPDHWQRAVQLQPKLRRNYLSFGRMRSQSGSESRPVSTNYSNDITLAKNVFLQLFHDALGDSARGMKEPNYERNLFVQYTTAVDTMLMEQLLAPILDHIKTSKTGGPIG